MNQPTGIKPKADSSEIVSWPSKSTLGTGLLWLILVLSVGFFYWPVLAKLIRKLASDDQYSFGLLLLACIPYIAFRQWPINAKLSGQTSWLGLIFLFFGFGLYLIGEVNTIVYLARISLVPLLAGMLVLSGGWRLLKLLSFPLLLLLIIIPLPDFLVNRLTLKLQLLSSLLAVKSLRLMGVVVNLHGNIIDLGHRQLQVVEACSGLGYLFSALALGCIFCYFYQRRPWKILLLLLSLVPFAITANALRLTLIALYPVFEPGFWHQVIGLAIFLLCVVYLSFNNGLLDHFGSPGTPVRKSSPPDSEAEARSSAAPSLLPVAVSLVMVLVLGFLTLRVGEVQPVPLSLSLDKFPLQFDSWQGRRRYLDPKVVAATGADTYLDVEYANPEKNRVHLWIAYYENQQAGGSVHSPLACLPGSGWQIVDSGVLGLSPGRPVKYLVIDQAGQRLLVYYWYFQQGRWLVDEYRGKLTIGLSRLFNRRGDGALVRLITPATGNLAESRTMLTSFTHQLVPILRRFLPY